LQRQQQQQQQQQKWLQHKQQHFVKEENEIRHPISSLKQPSTTQLNKRNAPLTSTNYAGSYQYK
jgi:hypothetical protein